MWTTRKQNEDFKEREKEKRWNCGLEERSKTHSGQPGKQEKFTEKLRTRHKESDTSE